MTINKRFIPIILSVVLLSFGFIWFKNHSSAKDHSLTTVQPQFRDITKTLELSGSVQAKKLAKLHFQTGGLVVYYPWQEGDTIKKYQTIASLDQRQLKKVLQEKLNLYAKQLNAFSQLRDDHQDKIDANDIDLQLKRILDNSQYDLNNAVLNVELQDLTIKYSYLTAPFTGILIKSPITSSHVNILPSDMFILVDPKSLYFSAELEEGDLAKVNLQTPATVVLDAFPNQKISVKIDRISFASKETSTGTVYPLELTFSSSKLPVLRLGLNGTAYLTLDHKTHVLSLPQEAVHEDDQGSFVYLLKDGHKQRQNIKLGLEGDDYVEIESGLSPSDQVLIKD